MVAGRNGDDVAVNMQGVDNTDNAGELTDSASSTPISEPNSGVDVAAGEAEFNNLRKALSHESKA